MYKALEVGNTLYIVQKEWMVRAIDGHGASVWKLDRNGEAEPIGYECVCPEIASVIHGELIRGSQAYKCDAYWWVHTQNEQYLEGVRPKETCCFCGKTLSINESCGCNYALEEEANNE